MPDAGRELDMRVAQAIGWTEVATRIIGGECLTVGRRPQGERCVVPYYSVSLEQAWKGAEIFAETHKCGFAVARNWLRTPMRPDIYQATIMGGDLAYDTPDLVFVVHANTPERALCLALVQASSIKVRP